VSLLLGGDLRLFACLDEALHRNCHSQRYLGGSRLKIRSGQGWSGATSPSLTLLLPRSLVLAAALVMTRGSSLTATDQQIRPSIHEWPMRGGFNNIYQMYI
jgi:hypothetical protein